MSNPAEHVFDYAIQYLTKTRGIVNTKQFNDAVELLSTHRTWITGMGKAALSAHKLASTLSCNGIPAGYIHAGEALHGDFGAIQSEDVLVSFSNSGKTDEVLRVSSKAKDAGTKLILITGNPNGDVAKIADVVLCYGEVREACSLGLTPTTSVIVMMAIADALSMAVQVKVGLTYEQYARNHHSGYLGQIAREKAADHS